MYTSSEEAIEANEEVSIKEAARELARHYCRIVAVCEATSPPTITVTNDCDEPEAIACTTKAIMEWLGY